MTVIGVNFIEPPCTLKLTMLYSQSQMLWGGSLYFPDLLIGSKLSSRNNNRCFERKNAKQAEFGCLSLLSTDQVSKVIENDIQIRCVYCACI